MATLGLEPVYRLVELPKYALLVVLLLLLLGLILLGRRATEQRALLLLLLDGQAPLAPGPTLKVHLVPQDLPGRLSRRAPLRRGPRVLLVAGAYVGLPAGLPAPLHLVVVRQDLPVELLDDVAPLLQGVVRTLELVRREVPSSLDRGTGRGDGRVARSGLLVAQAIRGATRRRAGLVSDRAGAAQTYSLVKLPVYVGVLGPLVNPAVAPRDDHCLSDQSASLTSFKSLPLPHPEIELLSGQRCIS